MRSWHLPDWFGGCCRRSGRSQLSDPLGAESQPGAAADGAHLRSCRPRLRGAASGTAAGAAPPALPAPGTCATRSLEATLRHPSPPALPLTLCLNPRAGRPSLVPSGPQSATTMCIRGVLRVTVLLLLIRTWLSEGNNASPIPKPRLAGASTAPKLKNVFDW